MRKSLVMSVVVLALCAWPQSLLAEQVEEKKEDEQVVFVKKELPINFKGLFSQTFSFLVVENSIRMMDASTRRELGGPFLNDWMQSIKSVHGWDDGDRFFPNYIGHPMQGSVSAFIFANNSLSSKDLEFGLNKAYFKAKKNQFIFALIYSELFELGPISEASLGNIGYRKGKNSYIDHVLTPVLGIVWSIGEDAVYHYWIKDVRERRPILGNLMLIGLNPTRALANALSLRYPWRGPVPR